MQVRGPCFNPSDKIKCFFGPIPTPGIYESQDSVICVSPATTEYGKIKVTVQVTNADGVTTFKETALFTSSKYNNSSCMLYKKSTKQKCLFYNKGSSQTITLIHLCSYSSQSFNIYILDSLGLYYINAFIIQYLRNYCAYLRLLWALTI